MNGPDVQLASLRDMVDVVDPAARIDPSQSDAPAARVEQNDVIAAGDEQTIQLDPCPGPPRRAPLLLQ
jgi:hypothetical protein